MRIFESLLEPSSDKLSNPTYKGAVEDYILFPHQGRVDELYHGHSEWSDGGSLVRDMIKEAAYLEVDFFGISDHLDLTGISNQEHQGSWLGNFSDNLEYRKESIEELIESLGVEDPQKPAYEVRIGRGAEIDFDPSNIGQLRENIIDLDMDYVIGSVHHDKNGIPIKSPQIIRDQSTDEKVDEYVRDIKGLVQLGQSIPKFTTIAHPGRAEEGPLGEEITVGTYYPILDDMKDSDLTYELNTKLHLRYYMNNGKLPAEFWALANYDDELPDISVGTDTHRVGHSESFNEEYKKLGQKMFSEDGSKITESQMRLKFGEELLNLLEEKRGEKIEVTSVLEGLDLPTARIHKGKAKKVA